MKKIIGLLLVSLWLFGCGDSDPKTPRESDKEVLVVSVLPQKYFLRKIAGDRYDIQVMIPPGYSPATFSPTPRQVRELDRAKIYFRIGYIGFESAWMDKIATLHPKLSIVDTSNNVPLIHAQHGHHHEGVEEGGVDPHIWLSPAAVKIQVANMLAALVKFNPELRDEFTRNHDQFLQEIEQLDVDIRTILRSVENRKFLVFHPAWSYFARDFALEQFPIEFEGKEPNPSGMKEVIGWAKSQQVRVIFVQRQFDTNSASAIANELDGEVVALDPLAEEWAANMRDIALTIKKYLAPGVE